MTRCAYLGAVVALVLFTCLPASAVTLYVDGVNGDDATAVPGDPAKPYATLTAAKNDAAVGDLIQVRPATYHEGDLLKDQVDWHFEDGAVVDYTPPAGVASPGIFDDTLTGKVVSDVTGFGVFTARHVAGSRSLNPFAGGCVIHADDPDTDLFVEGKELVGIASIATVFQGAGRVWVEADEVFSDNYDCIWLTGDGIVFTGFIETIHTTNDNGIELGFSPLSSSAVTIVATDILAVNSAVNVFNLGGTGGNIISIQADTISNTSTLHPTVSVWSTARQNFYLLANKVEGDQPLKVRNNSGTNIYAVGQWVGTSTSKPPIVGINNGAFNNTKLANGTVTALGGQPGIRWDDSGGLHLEVMDVNAGPTATYSLELTAPDTVQLTGASTANKPPSPNVTFTGTGTYTY